MEGGGGVKGVRVIMRLLRGLGACSPINFLNFIHTEIASGAFSDSFAVLKGHDEMPRFLELI